MLGDASAGATRVRSRHANGYRTLLQGHYSNEPVPHRARKQGCWLAPAMTGPRIAARNRGDAIRSMIKQPPTTGGLTR